MTRQARTGADVSHGAKSIEDIPIAVPTIAVAEFVAAIGRHRRPERAAGVAPR